MNDQTSSNGSKSVDQKRSKGPIETDGGAFITGNVDTGGGDFIGRDVIQQPTKARELSELRKLQEEKLSESIAAYTEAQVLLKQQLDNPPRLESPYKGLDYFEELDQAIFFGRDEEADALSERLLHPKSRVLILHAPSGAGKTSLIRAGLIPRLIKRGIYTFWGVIQPYPQGIYQAVLDYAVGAPDYSDVPLKDFLGWVWRHLRHTSNEPLVLFLDQFERTFDSSADSDLSRILSDLQACVQTNDRVLPVRLVISIRSDYVGFLDRFRESIPSILNQREMLEPLSSEQAIQAIVRPLEGWSVQWKEAAAQAVLDYLAKGAIELPHLQLICAQLYERADKEGRTFISIDDVAGHDLEMLHRQYLQNQVMRLQDPEKGWQTLKLLVSSQGVSQPHSQDEIEQILGTSIKETLRDLVEFRVLRASADAGGKRIEIAHETLAREILSHESPQEIRRKAAIELIGRGLDDWLSHPSAPLLGVDRLSILDEYRDIMEPTLLGGEGISSREKGAREFLFRSALDTGHEILYWARRALDVGLEVNSIAIEGLKSESFRKRISAINAVDQITSLLMTSSEGLASITVTNQATLKALEQMLADYYPQVRVAAIRVLVHMQPTGKWRTQLKQECYVPAGPFIMGDSYEAHEVYLDAFYIGRYPVTNAAFKLYMDDIGQPFEIPFGKADHPVVNVSWNDARAYAEWANMRLLSEAEWEKAASWEETQNGEGIKRLYPWKGDISAESIFKEWFSRGRDTTAVGKYSPDGDSPYGCADMAYNVWEWTTSLHHDYPYQANDGREDKNTVGVRVLRGGSWWDGDYAACCVNRDYAKPDFRWFTIGFRCGL